MINLKTFQLKYVSFPSHLYTKKSGLHSAKEPDCWSWVIYRESHFFPLLFSNRIFYILFQLSKLWSNLWLWLLPLHCHGKSLKSTFVILNFFWNYILMYYLMSKEIERLFRIFMAFSEYMNFNGFYQSSTLLCVKNVKSWAFLKRPPNLKKIFFMILTNCVSHQILNF